jgi:putative oxidoreductase
MDLTVNLGRLVLRVGLGALLLFHGVAKIHRGIEGIVDRVGGAGLPSSLAYLVYVGEVVAPVLLIVGLWSRAAAVIVAVNMIVAVWLAHPSQLWELGRGGGWALELQAFYFFSAVAIMLLGAGKFSVGGAEGKLN